MTIDVVRVRTSRTPRNEHDEPPRHRDATIDVSDLPAEQVETYVERAVGDGYDAYLERRGTTATLTAVREAPMAERGALVDSPAPDERDVRPDDQSATEWDYAVFATERTPQ